MVSTTYIKLKGFIRDEEDANWEAQIEFNDLDGNLKTIAIPRENLMDQKQVTQILASEGYQASVTSYYTTTSKSKGQRRDWLEHIKTIG